MALKDIVEQYFMDFSNKDILSLEKAFAGNIVLRDWEIEANGIDSVIAANKNIFNNVKTITIEIQNLYQENNIVIGEIKIILNQSETLKVVDIFEFNEKDEIERISAYKG